MLRNSIASGINVASTINSAFAAQNAMAIDVMPAAIAATSVNSAWAARNAMTQSIEDAVSIATALSANSAYSYARAAEQNLKWLKQNEASISAALGYIAKSPTLFSQYESAENSLSIAFAGLSAEEFFASESLSMISEGLTDSTYDEDSFYSALNEENFAKTVAELKNVSLELVPPLNKEQKIALVIKDKKATNPITCIIIGFIIGTISTRIINYALDQAGILTTKAAIHSESCVKCSFTENIEIQDIPLSLTEEISIEESEEPK